MSTSKNSKIFVLVAAMLIIVAIIVRLSMHEPPKPPPSAPGYYTGPLRGKGGGNKAADEEGHIFDIPASETKKASKDKKDSQSPDKSAPKTNE